MWFVKRVQYQSNTSTSNSLFEILNLKFIPASNYFRNHFNPITSNGKNLESSLFVNCPSKSKTKDNLYDIHRFICMFLYNGDFLLFLSSVLCLILLYFKRLKTKQFYQFIFGHHHHHIDTCMIFTTISAIFGTSFWSQTFFTHVLSFP